MVLLKTHGETIDSGICNWSVNWIPGGVVRTGGLVSEGVQVI